MNLNKYFYNKSEDKSVPMKGHFLHKIKFYCGYGKMFFLVESFLSNRRP